MIDNKNSDNFDHKIERAKEAVYQMMEIPTGSHFFKKFLLKKDPKFLKKENVKQFPVDFDSFSHVTIDIYEDFIELQGKDKEFQIANSVVKKGSKDSYSYTHEVILKKLDQVLHKKKNITAHEYLNLLESKLVEFRTLYKERKVAIINGVYYKVDYYPYADGQPLILTMQLQDSYYPFETEIVK